MFCMGEVVKVVVWTQMRCFTWYIIERGHLVHKHALSMPWALKSWKTLLIDSCR